MKRILVVPTNGIGYEGITSVIYNYLSNMDLTNLHVDVLTYDTTPDELLSKFSGIASVTKVPNRKKEKKNYIAKLESLLKENKYDVIHVHGNSGTMMIETVLAKKNKVNRILVHCHSTECDHPYLNVVMRLIMKATASDYLACSDASGKFLYGSSQFTVFNNAIDLGKFKFSPQVREGVRKELGVGDEYLIGHIGHFTPQKNHFFLIDIFEVFHKKHSDAKLLLVGEGTDFDGVKEKVKNLGLDEVVIFAGSRDDCERLYQGMDLFILPSRWEGLPLVLVEAQAAGLPCLVSDVVTRDAKCIDNCVYFPLSAETEDWAKEMESLLLLKNGRSLRGTESFVKQGFDIKVEAQKLRDLYMN